jgi:FKBP-type peptidyl-prolyl cis-trans isomerase FklB
VGVYFGNQIKRSTMDVDVDVVTAAIKDVLAGKEPRLTDQQSQEAISAFQKESQAKAADKNKKEGEAFLAANKTKPGVKTQSVSLPDGTTAEMQYKVITEGTGAMPKSNDVVSVNYRGTLINGKEFDSSTKHGGPLKRPANSLVKGWTEALQMMKTGSKWELYLPAALAYGDRGGQGIEPGTTLIFEMELLSFDTPQPPPPPQPLTSDIIRVPSAEELKAGAKVEVIKAEDLEKQMKAAAATNSAATNSSPKKP